MDAEFLNVTAHHTCRPSYHYPFTY